MPGSRVKTIAFGGALVVAAVVAGFAAALLVIVIANAFLPPFRPEDDDTLREFIPVAIAYVAGGTTALIGLVAGWRSITR